jgi:hypothetical protein
VDGVIDEAAGVHLTRFVSVGAHDVITPSAQAREDALGVHQCLGAAEETKPILGKTRATG